MSSKVDTDQGLGPGSENRRREVRKAQDELEVQSERKPVVVDKTAVTEPGVGKVERRSDTVDDLLDGFGTSRQDLPRILPNKDDTTPPPEPVRRELTPTQPGKRQRRRNTIVAGVISFGIIIGIGVLVAKASHSSSASSTAETAPAATTTPTAPTAPTTPGMATTAAPDTAIAVPTIVTTAVEALPTVKTAAPLPTHPIHISTTRPTTTSPPATTTAAPRTTVVPHPTGSAPPGLNLLPDDPHR